MRQLQSRIQGLRFSARGQETPQAETDGVRVRSEFLAVKKLMTTGVERLESKKPFDWAFLLAIPLLLLVIIIGGVSVNAQITFGGPDDRFVNDVDRIHQGDLIEVDVVGSFEFDWRGTLNPEGFIDGIERLSEPVYARCRSTAQIAYSIAEGYRKVLRDPVVEVRIIDRNGRALSFVDGAVKTPLRLRVKRDLYLNELVVLAGGFTDVVGDEISLFRPVGASCEGARDGEMSNTPLTRVVKIRDLLAGVGGTNLKIVPGDIVTVVESLPIYVIGGVGTPQRLSARTGITLSRAIDAAGGISKKGRAGSVTIYRRKGPDSQVLEIDLAKVRTGQEEDLSLEANDIVEVPLKGEEKRKFPPVIESRGGDRSQIPLRIIE